MGDKQRNAERDREILRLHRCGLSFREIGRRYGLSGQRVRDVCDHEEHVDRLRLTFPAWVDFNTKQALRREGITDEKSLLARAREKGKIYGIGPERIGRILYGEEEIDGERFALSEETRQELIRLLKLEREPEKRQARPDADQRERDRTERLERALSIAAEMFAAEGYFAPGGDGGPKAIRRFLLKKARAELEQEKANALTADADRCAARRDRNRKEKKEARTRA